MAFALKGCDKCGGDLEWVEDTHEVYWHCIQCGHDQKEPGGLDKMELTTKRRYTKGPDFYKRYPNKMPIGYAESAKTPDEMHTGVEYPPHYWEGYRQAVLDMSPK